MMQSKVYQHQICVETGDLDELNHVNNISYLRFIQDIAQAHWVSVIDDNLLKNSVWVARRHEIDYLKQAFLGDKLTVKTWVDNFTGVTSIRHCEIYRDESLIAQSKTIWVSVNPKTLKPQRISAEMVSMFFT